MKGFLEKFFPDILTRETTQVGDLYCTYNDQRIQWFTSSLFLAGAATEISGTTGGPSAFRKCASGKSALLGAFCGVVEGGATS